MRRRSRRRGRLLVFRCWIATQGGVGLPPLMAAPRSKHLVLILAREFASNLATPTLITDERGWLVFYNEAAEEVLGRPFAEVGELPLEDWTPQFSPRTLDTEEPLPLAQRPTGIALYERRAAHERFRITS